MDAAPSPLDSPLKGHILFPDEKPSLVETRLDKLENQLDLLKNNFSTLKQTVDHNQQTVNQRLSVLEQKLDTLLALIRSPSSSANVVLPSPSQPILQESDPTTSASQCFVSSVLPAPLSEIPKPQVSAVQAPRSKTQAPIAWNGANSQVEAAPMHTRPTAAPKVKASDQPPKVSQALATSSAFPRRTTPSPPLVHHVSRVAEGEPPNGSCNYSPISAVAPPLRPSEVWGGGTTPSVKIQDLLRAPVGCSNASFVWIPRQCDILPTTPTGPASPGPDPTNHSDWSWLRLYRDVSP